MQGVEQRHVARLRQRHQGPVHALGRRPDRGLLEPRGHRTEDELLGLRGHQVAEVGQGDLVVTGTGQLVAQPGELVPERVDGLPLEHVAEGGQGAAQPPGRHPQLVDGVRLVGAQQHVRGL